VVENNIVEHEQPFAVTAIGAPGVDREPRPWLAVATTPSPHSGYGQVAKALVSRMGLKGWPSGLL
jgi:hypothetical protein